MKHAHLVAADPAHLYDLVTDVTRAPEWHPARSSWSGSGRGSARPGSSR